MVCEENALTGKHEAASAALLSGIAFRQDQTRIGPSAGTRGGYQAVLQRGDTSISLRLAAPRRCQCQAQIRGEWEQADLVVPGRLLRPAAAPPAVQHHRGGEEPIDIACPLPGTAQRLS